MIKGCITCGTAILSMGGKRLYCEECLKKRRLAAQHEWYLRRRRKNPSGKFAVLEFYRGEWIEFTGQFERAGVKRWIQRHLGFWLARGKKLALFEGGEMLAELAELKVAELEVLVK